MFRVRGSASCAVNDRTLHPGSHFNIVQAPAKIMSTLKAPLQQLKMCLYGLVRI